MARILSQPSYISLRYDRGKMELRKQEVYLLDTSRVREGFVQEVTMNPGAQ